MVSCNSGISEFCHTSGDVLCVLCAQISPGNNCVFYCNSQVTLDGEETSVSRGCCP